AVTGQLVPGVHVRAADDDDVVGLATLTGLPRPGGTAPGVTGCATSRQGHVAESYRVAVVEHAVDRARLPARPVVEVLTFAPRGDHPVVASHHVDLRARHFAGQGVACDVVVVCVTGEQDLDVTHLEPERLDRRADQWDGVLEPGVDQDVTLGGRDQVAGE